MNTPKITKNFFISTPFRLDLPWLVGKYETDGSLDLAYKLLER